MKKIILIILVILNYSIYAQKVEKVDKPERVVYNYCKMKIFEKAKDIVTKELKEQPEYTLTDKILFVGPVLWTRLSKIKELSNIKGGNLTLLVDNDKLTGKMTQDIEDSKKIWNQIREEVKDEDFKLRKATYDELDYYWTVISWDIEEPLIIVETSKHKYILDINPKKMTLLWLDEVPE